ncbi:MAG TPA: S1C family serine protease [Candidatus Acidoferrales bacterium]|nr:S1C family serine protease [Candidatus Acidoferrales bacterium]
MRRTKQRIGAPGLFSVVIIGALLLSPTGAAQNQPAAPTPQISFTAQVAKTVASITAYYTEAGATHSTSGTCFFVFIPDERIGKSGYFKYLVTNRHVATALGMPQSEIVPLVDLRVNLTHPQGQDGAADIRIPLTGNMHWYFPSDSTVDLAVLPGAPSPESVDMKAIPISILATNDILKSQTVDLGDPVFFVGYFFQFPGLHRADPIYRNGAIAMMPTDPILMRAEGNDKPISEHLYLADAHAFLGNSGSPLFVNLGGFRNGVVTAGGSPYYLLGVVNGFIPESADGNVMAATLEQGVKENLHSSGVLTFVPAQELWDFLYSPVLKHQRDEVAASTQKK